MSPVARLAGEKRREAILEASLQLFADHGLHGVTTRQIAQAAGVSEALLYRHFQSKDELYAMLQQSCIGDTTRIAERMAKLEPSTSTLVLAVYFMVSQILRNDIGPVRQACVRRLMLGSLLEDGAFARGFLQSNMGRFIPMLVECVKTAAKRGDLVDGAKRPALRLWFAHHLTAMVGNVQMPVPPAVDYGVGYEVLVEETVRFALRGLGLTQDAIQRHFNPGALSLLVRGLAEEVGGEPTPLPRAKKLSPRSKTK